LANTNTHSQGHSYRHRERWTIREIERERGTETWSALSKFRKLEAKILFAYKAGDSIRFVSIASFGYVFTGVGHNWICLAVNIMSEVDIQSLTHDYDGCVSVSLCVERQTDRQADRLTDRQADKQTRQIDIPDSNALE